MMLCASFTLASGLFCRYFLTAKQGKGVNGRAGKTHIYQSCRAVN